MTKICINDVTISRVLHVVRRLKGKGESASKEEVERGYHRAYPPSTLTHRSRRGLSFIEERPRDQIVSFSILLDYLCSEEYLYEETRDNDSGGYFLTHKGRNRITRDRKK